MILKKINPVTPSQRELKLLNTSTLAKKILIKSETKGLNKNAGRNNLGRITSFKKSGGHKRTYRNIDFRRSHLQGIISSIEYDPNRTAYIASVFDFSKKKHVYIILPKGLKKGSLIKSGAEALSKIGHSLVLSKIPLGTYIHNVSLIPNGGGKLVRSAGGYAQLIQKTQHYVRIKLLSGQQKFLNLDCTATLGIVSNENHNMICLGKAGRSRWLGIKPTVRGVAMNPIDHPHGGGEGKTSGGRPSVTPWGKPTKGQPTTRNLGQKLILSKLREA
jgi:large subunit ribosomal protein L2